MLGGSSGRGADAILLRRLPGVCRDNLRAFWVLHCNWALWFTMLSICPYLMASDFWGGCPRQATGTIISRAVPNEEGTEIVRGGDARPVSEYNHCIAHMGPDFCRNIPLTAP